MNTPTEAAIRAAKPAVSRIEGLLRDWFPLSEYVPAVNEVAEIIDRETHLPQLMDALGVAMRTLNLMQDEGNAVAADAIRLMLDILGPAQKQSPQTQSHELTSSSAECHTPAPAEEAEPLHRQMAADTLR